MCSFRVRSVQQTSRPFCCCAMSVWVWPCQRVKKKQSRYIRKLNEKINTYTHCATKWHGITFDRCLHGAQTYIVRFGIKVAIDIYDLSLKIELSIMVWLLHSSFHCCRRRCHRFCRFFSLSLCVFKFKHVLFGTSSLLMGVTRPMFEKHDTQPFILKTKRMDERRRLTQKNNTGRRTWDSERDGSWVNGHGTHEVLIVFASSPLLILFVSTNALKRTRTHKPNGTKQQQQQKKQWEYGQMVFSSQH